MWGSAWRIRADKKKRRPPRASRNRSPPLTTSCDWGWKPEFHASRDAVGVTVAGPCRREKEKGPVEARYPFLRLLPEEEPDRTVEIDYGDTDVWALVLKPGTPAAHHEGAKHDCSLDGAAYGYVSGSQVVIPTLGSLIVSCKHK